MLRTGEIHLVEHRKGIALRRVHRLTGSAEEGTGTEIPLQIAVAQHLGAVGPIGADGDDVGRAPRRLGHEEGQARLPDPRHAGEDHERLRAQRRHEGGHLPRLVDEPPRLDRRDEALRRLRPVPSFRRRAVTGPRLRHGRGSGVAGLGALQALERRHHRVEVTALARADEEFQHLPVDVREGVDDALGDGGEAHARVLAAAGVLVGHSELVGEGLDRDVGFVAEPDERADAHAVGVGPRPDERRRVFERRARRLVEPGEGAPPGEIGEDAVAGADLLHRRPPDAPHGERPGPVVGREVLGGNGPEPVRHRGSGRGAVARRGIGKIGERARTGRGAHRRKRSPFRLEHVVYGVNIAPPFQ